jgi:hypothetical protein
MATDPVQILREAIVAVLDTHADVVAITGRATENVVAWGNLGDIPVANREAGIIAYHAIVASEVANELVNVVRRVVIGQAFHALVPPIDAVVTNRVRRPMPFDPEDGLARSDIDITIRAYFPALV